MIALRVFGALAVALAVQLFGAWAWQGFPLVLDPFLVVVVYFGLRLGPIPAQLLGLGAGLLVDGIAGTPWGLHGFAGTLVGFGVSVAAQRVVVGQRGVRVLLFAVASTVQLAVIAGLLLLVMARPELPPLGWSALRVAFTALVGAALLATEERLERRWRLWQRQRSGRLRFR